MVIPLDAFELPDLPEATEPPKRKSRRKVVPAEKAKPVAPPVVERPDNPLKKTEFDGDNTPVLYLNELNAFDLRSSADEYLASVSDEVPPLLGLMRKFNRYEQLMSMYKNEEELLESEKAELKELHQLKKRGEFQPLFDELTK